MAMKRTRVHIGTPLLLVSGIATAILIALKLTGHIRWPLMWAFAPLAFALVVLAIASVVFVAFGWDKKPS